MRLPSDRVVAAVARLIDVGAFGLLFASRASACCAHPRYRGRRHGGRDVRVGVPKRSKQSPRGGIGSAPGLVWKSMSVR